MTGNPWVKWAIQVVLLPALAAAGNTLLESLSGQTITKAVLLHDLHLALGVFIGAVALGLQRSPADQATLKKTGAIISVPPPPPPPAAAP